MDEQAQELAARSTGGRYIELDSLRGLAAVTVVFYHLGKAYSIPQRWYVRPFISGPEAVTLFFVLSGFVLSLPFWNKGKNGPYFRYLIRRFFRIYVPYLAAVAVALIGASIFMNSRLPLGEWFNLTWHTTITAKLIGREILMDTTPALNTAFWSLRYEMLLSITFPALLAAMKLLTPLPALAITLAIHLGINAVMPHPWQSKGLLDAIHYGTIFVFGALLAAERQRLRMLWDRLSRTLKLALLLISAFLYFGYGGGLGLALHVQAPADLLCAAGASGLILCALFSRDLSRILRHRIPEYLGRVSYSLYLMHGTVLFALLNLLYSRTSTPIIVTAVVVTSFVLAHLFCIGIEEPSLRLGKALSVGPMPMARREKI